MRSVKDPALRRDGAQVETQDVPVGLLQDVQRFLIPRWLAWGRLHGRQVGEAGDGMCRFTSAFLLKVLGPRWRLQSGSPDCFDFQAGRWLYDHRPLGILGTDGRWHAHTWVSDGQTIIDLTAGQFGWDNAVLSCTRDDPRYAPEPMTKLLRFEILRDVNERAESWLREWRVTQHYGQSEPESARRPRDWAPCPR